jgi:hypothetical protein
LDALAAYLPRYAVVAAEAGIAAPDARFRVVDRVHGGANTDFGVPHEIAPRDAAALNAAALKRTVALVKAAWVVLDRVAASAPAELRKGPRGGGRDRDQIEAHVREAHQIYERQLERGRWPKPYMVRRAAWHILDHLWEIEDKSQP